MTQRISADHGVLASRDAEHVVRTTRPFRPLLLGLVVGALATFVVLVCVLWPHRSQPPVLDLVVGGWVQAHRMTGLTTLARLLTWSGSAPVVVAAASLGAGWLWRFRRQGQLAAIYLVALAVTAGAVVLIKIVVARRRPDTATLLGSPALDYSFPSGHTTDSAVTYVLFAVVAGLTMSRGRRLLTALLTALLVGLAVGVGLSRVYLGYHFLTDVIGGWLFATAVIATTALVLSSWWVRSAREAASRADVVLRQQRPEIRLGRSPSPHGPRTAGRIP